jgi:hypothetical protein
MLRNLIIIGVTAFLGCGAGFSNGAMAAEKKSGDAKAGESDSRFSDKVLGLKELKDLPKRPEPLFELWQDYVNQGPYGYEFELPTGMVVSPGLLLFGNINTGLEITDNGVDDTTTEWITTANIFLNLTLSGTERILVGFSPLKGKSTAKTRYTFEPTSEWHNESSARMTTLFFEGELSEMFPNLDMEGRLPLDYEIAVGRQPVIIQGGMLIQDTLDSVALTRSTVPLPGTNFARISGLVAWSDVHRSDNVDDNKGELYGLFSSVEVAHSTIELDMAYVDSTRAIGDQFNIAASLIRPFIILEHDVDTTIRVATSYTPDEETAKATDGTLLYASFSWAPKRTDDIIYLNAFGALDSYAPAARTPGGGGGPLGIVGLLFAGNGLAGPAINNLANNTAYGGALGYQMFFSPALRRNLIFEVGGKVDNSSGGIDRFGVAVRYSQALGQHAFFEVGGFAVEQESIDDAFGLRTKLNIMF